MQRSPAGAYTARYVSNADAPWFRLDNAALVFPAIAGRRHTTIFRISISLKEPVDVARLDAALERMAKRTPYFQVELRRGVFWYLFETNRAIPRVMPDSRHPNMDFRIRGPGRFPYRVRAYRNRIALEVSHILTDGTGALRFLRSLVAEYLLGRRAHDVENDIRAGTDLLLPGEAPDPREGRDSFREHYRPDVPPLPRKESAWRLPGRAVSSRY